MFSYIKRLFVPKSKSWQWAVFCLVSGQVYTIRHRKTIPNRPPGLLGSLAEFVDLENAIQYLHKTLGVDLAKVYIITPEREYRADKLATGSNRKV